jgi:hypothetical protein
MYKTCGTSCSHAPELPVQTNTPGVHEPSTSAERDRIKCFRVQLARRRRPRSPGIWRAERNSELRSQKRAMTLAHAYTGARRNRR